MGREGERGRKGKGQDLIISHSFIFVFRYPGLQDGSPAGYTQVQPAIRGGMIAHLATIGDLMTNEKSVGAERTEVT